jgi:methyltransferase (TIGR00027 family)
MIENRRSITAERVAMRRAVHQVLDAPPVLDDPLALRILGLQPADIPSGDMDPLMARINRQRRAFFAVRGRYAEDELAALVARGGDQYVVLGAGLDTFAYRNPHRSLRVFEIDHPATQGWKRERLAQSGIPVPSSVTFVPVDFEGEQLSDALVRAGFDARRPALFAWLGVVPYLERDAIVSTLRYIASCAAGATVVFDYGIPPDGLPPRLRAAFDAVARRVAAAGEPWRTFFRPSEIAGLLRDAGFTRLDDVDGEALNERYFASRADGLRLEGIGRLAHLARAER